jgi:hypothetical protein
MTQLTGLALFTQDVLWIVAQFRPPLIEVQCTTRYLGRRVWEVSEVAYRYSRYEINIDNGGVADITNIRISKIAGLSIHKVIFLKTPRISIDEAVAIAKRLIKKNKSLLEG